MTRKHFKVLLIYPNTMMATLVPLSISQLSACLKSESIEVELFDTTYYKTEEVSFEQRKVDLLMFKPFSYDKQGITFKQTDIYEDLNKKVSDFKPDLIGITIVENTHDLAKSLLESIKDSDIPVVAGGVFATLCPEMTVSDGNIDMVCIGEGEEPLVELCKRMSKGQDYSDVKNLWVKKDNKIIKNPLMCLVDINDLPYVDYDVFDNDRLYRPMFGQVRTMIHVEIDRGCPYGCTYCCAPSLKKLYQDNGCGVYYRRKRTARVIAEMKHLVKKYKPDYVNFNSETFLAKPMKEFKEFARLYKKINIPFWCQTRPETITEEKIKILKEMNCDTLQFGIEVGNEEFRNKVLNRHDTNERILKGLAIVERYKIPYTANNIIGFPSETRKLIFDTININRKIHPRTMNCNLMTPYRGTYMFKYCVEKGYLDKDAKIYQIIDGAEMRMDSITYTELKGLQRTFSLYVRFPKSEWDKIRIAERFDEEGNMMFERLKKRYQRMYYS